MSSKNFGKALRTLREEKGLSQRALAAKVRLTQAYIAELETGTRTNPTMNTLRRLAKALGVPGEKLIA